MRKHKVLGQVYTPDWVVNEILDQVGYSGERILDKYILEPASGDGAFLREIVRRYLRASLDQDRTVGQIVAGLEKYIHGVELDPSEYRKSLAKLDEVVEVQVSDNIKVRWNIHNENTLEYYKSKPDFFDFVVGNPPYIRIHNLEENVRKQIKQELTFSEGTFDMYLSFFEMGYFMLKEKGCLGYITPNSFLHNSSYKVFREFLKKKRAVTSLTDFKSNKLFKGYSTYTAITILEKGKENPSFDYREWTGSEIKLVNTIDFDEVNTKDWSFTDAKNEEFLIKVLETKRSRIKDFFDVQYGFATLRDKIFIGKAEISEEEYLLFNGEVVERGLFKKIVKGSRFKGNLDACEVVLFPYELSNTRYEVIPEEVLKHTYPKTYAYLLKNKVELQKRDLDKGAVWYEFGRSQGVQSVHNEKIVLSTLVNDAVHFYRVPADVMVYSGLFIIQKDASVEWDLIEEVLKSADFYKYIRLTGKDFSGGYKSITSKQIKEYGVDIVNPFTLF